MIHCFSKFISFFLGLAALREHWADAIVSVIAAIPAIGQMFAPLKYLKKIGGKFAKWGGAFLEAIQCKPSKSRKMMNVFFG